MKPTLTLDSLSSFLDGKFSNPAGLLGPEVVEQGGRRAMAVRAFLPQCHRAWVVDECHRQWPMRRLHATGFFEALCPLPAENAPVNYQIQLSDRTGSRRTMHDPYAFEPWFTDFDLYLLGQGTNWRIYDKMGARRREIEGVRGTNFAVWAPNAQQVSVVGDFNEWDGRRHPMVHRGDSGLWELFLPGLDVGQRYKFRVTSSTGEVVDKADPYGVYAELPPCTASITADLDHYIWRDEEWLEARRERPYLHAPMSVYEVHLGSWQRDHSPNGWMNYRELAHRLVEYCRAQHHTHVELLPVSEHPFTGSWGYQTTGYYSVTSRYGTPEDFMYFVDYCHQHEIGVIIDWVPAHFPKDAHGLRRFDGTALYEHEDPRRGEHPDWGTLIFNYGRNEVRNFLIANALFWLDKYHIDGLRVDAVASMLYLDYSREEGDWLPNQHGGSENLEAIDFLKVFNERVHADYPGVVTIAEESTAWPGVSRPTFDGGLGFSLKWNMGWMNDTLRYFQKDPIHRRHHHDELTFSLIYSFHENFVLPLSHDEIVHGKGSLLDQMPGDLWQRFANLRLLYAYMWSHPGKKLIFMGDEIGQWSEWNHDAEIDWDLLQWPKHVGAQRLIADLNRLHQTEPALHELDFHPEGFCWIDCHNSTDSVLAFLRQARDPQDHVLICGNFTPVVRENYRIGVPREGWYAEILNSDSEHYGGSNVGNGPGRQAEPIEHHGQPYSLEVTLPPLAICMLKPQ